MTTASNEARIMAAERALQTAPEPGGLQGTNTGDEDVPITNTRVTSAGYVTMWNTDTKEPSIFNMNGVRAKLKEVFPKDYVNNPSMRGLSCWTPDQPNESPWRGNVTCPLHADRPERAAFDAVGYPRCHKNNIPNEMEAQRHLLRKHHQEWEMMNTQRLEIERIAQEEDRSLNRKILAHLAGVPEDTAPVDVIETPQPPEAPEAPETIEAPDIPDIPNVPDAPVVPEPASDMVYLCNKCKSNHRLDSSIGRRHKRHKLD
jgi:hypothetical protein|tara:strand:- start:419 stop:1195 length:777 start_codon:yes stop_codon:yes gene_type:complete